MGLSSLTDKQKQDIGAVYSANEEQFKSLNKQMNELRKSEWDKIEPLLTKDQLSQLGVSGGADGAPGDAPSTPASPAPKGK